MSTTTQKSFSIYVLRLEDGKFYIGMTSKTPQERFLEHKNGFYGAEWTKLYKPISIEQSKDLGFVSYEKAEEYENLITRKYIKKYGLNNVRGGNITYRGKMVRRAGYYWRDEDWKDLVYISIAVIWIFSTTVYIIWDYYTRHNQ